MTDTRLVAMANQIAQFFASQPDASASEGTAEHLRLFWNPVMLRDLYDQLDKDPREANPIVIGAVQQLRKVSIRS